LISTVFPPRLSQIDAIEWMASLHLSLCSTALPLLTSSNLTGKLILPQFCLELSLLVDSKVASHVFRHLTHT
jgi:hypothetical protein